MARSEGAGVRRRSPASVTRRPVGQHHEERRGREVDFPPAPPVIHLGSAGRQADGDGSARYSATLRLRRLPDSTNGISRPNHSPTQVCPSNSVNSVSQAPRLSTSYSVTMEKNGPLRR